MKNLVVIFLCFVSVSLSVAAGSADTLKVMTYNLRFGELASLEQISAYIEKNNPDLVALQECDWKTNRELTPHQKGKAFINEIAYNTGFFGLYGKAITYKGGYYGIGILSKYPIIRTERLYLPNPEPQREQRVMLIADVEMPDNSVLTFICTHLEVSSAATRKAQVKYINYIVGKIKTPVILAGDFNAIPKDEEIKNGFSKWINATDSTYTHTVLAPSIKIDYIYGYPKGSMRLISTCTDTTCKLSDHFPVFSKLLIQPK